MEYRIYIKTKFDVGDTIYYIAGRNIVKSKIVNINFFGSVSDSYANYLYIMEDGVYVDEKSMYKTEYEAKIVLGNAI